MSQKNVKCKDAEWIWPWLKAISRKQCWFDATFVSTFCNPSWSESYPSLCASAEARRIWQFAVFLALSWRIPGCGLRSLLFLEEVDHTLSLGKKITKHTQRIHEDARQGLAVFTTWYVKWHKHLVTMKCWTQEDRGVVFLRAI